VRVVLDRDDVTARSRCVKGDSHRAGRGVLRDRRMLTNTVGVKHIAPALNVELAGEVARGDRLSDRKGVVAGWHCHRHPVEEHTGGDVVLDLPAADAVIQVAQGRGRAVPEL
jgi:predicted phage tail protein